MGEIFLKLFNISIISCWIVLAVVIFRIVFKRAPKWSNCLLWAVVGVRLIMPFSIESVFSLIPSTEVIDTTTYIGRPYLQTGISVVDKNVNDYLGSNYFEGVSVPADNFANLLNVISIFWIIGIAVMLGYSIISYLRLHRKVKASLIFKDNIYFCDDIASPFLIGVFKPRIYLPAPINSEQMQYIIDHENAHLKRGDHIWKPLGFMLLSVYWFNPVMWAAYILFCRDIELACDEKVIKKMDTDAKKGYLNALVDFSVQQRVIPSCPLTFGEVGVKDRIKSVFSYKKPAFWVVIIAIIALIAIALCFLTNPAGIKITQLNENEVEFRGVFNDVKQIKLVSGTNTFITDDKETVDQIIVDLMQVRINSRPISRSRAEDRDNTNRITINDRETLCFSKDFTELWIYTGVKPTFSYKVLNPAVASKAFKVTPENPAEANGVIYFYAEPTDENEDPVIEKRYELSADDLSTLMKLLSKHKWVNNDTVDRLSFKYNGALYYDGWIYFGYEQKIICYENYFCATTDEVLNIIRNKYESANPYLNESRDEGKNTNVGYNPNFNATVLEIYENSVLVEPFADSEIFSTADKIVVTTDVYSTNPVPEMEKGTQIRVVYNGMIQETYPARLPLVFAIYLLEDVK